MINKNSHICAVHDQVMLTYAKMMDIFANPIHSCRYISIKTALRNPVYVCMSSLLNGNTKQILESCKHK